MDEAPSLMGDTRLKQVTEQISNTCDEHRIRVRSCLGVGGGGGTEETRYRKGQAGNPAPGSTT